MGKDNLQSSLASVLLTVHFEIMSLSWQAVEEKRFFPWESVYLIQQVGAFLHVSVV